TEMPPGWSYRPASGGHSVGLFFNFADAEETVFFGMCQKGEPTFGIGGGNYPLGATQFTLTVDGRSWDLPAFQGNHGRMLFVDDREPAEAIARAKRVVAFRVREWERQLRPDRPLHQFASDCSG
ncbi:MAG TPA: hypothetical protein VFU80_00120, partial [Sphingomicrobium sp.]|nr:hypothetical protein [Sphingomicrobium sp.]